MSTGSVEIGVDLNGEQLVARQFELADEWSRDLREPLDELMDQILVSVRLQFATEGAAGGTPWAPLSDQYGTWKAEHYPGRPILVRDGLMKEAMLNKTEAVRVGLTEATYAPVSEIAGYHQFGADWLGPAWNHPGPYHHHLPARKMLDLSESFKHEAVDRVFTRWVARKLAEDRVAAKVVAA
jgi:hypothetical protein